MNREGVSKLGSFEGRRIGLSLVDGSRLDDCQLVSAGRARVGTLWVFSNGADIFVPFPDVTDVWEIQAA